MLPIAQPRYFRGHWCSQSPLWYFHPDKTTDMDRMSHMPNCWLWRVNMKSDTFHTLEIMWLNAWHARTAPPVRLMILLSLQILSHTCILHPYGSRNPPQQLFLLVTCMLASYHETFYLCACGSTLKLFWEFLIIVVLKPFSYSWTFCWQVCFVIFVGSRPSSRTSSAWDFPKQNSGQSYGSLYVCALGKSSLFSEWKDN
jgi:hypothetical protein